LGHVQKQARALRGSEENNLKCCQGNLFYLSLASEMARRDKCEEQVYTLKKKWF
jgi:hypothetical protein